MKRNKLAEAIRLFPPGVTLGHVNEESPFVKGALTVPLQGIIWGSQFRLECQAGR